MKLNIIEKFLLIAQDPEKGKFLISDIHINYGIIGALLLEMSFDNRIIIEKNKLIMKEHKNIDNSMDAEIYSIITNSKKIRKVHYWISNLDKQSKIIKLSILSNFEKNGMVRIEKKKFIGLFPYTKYFLIEKSIRENLIQQVKNNILQDKSLNNEDIALLGLIVACDMYKIISSDRTEAKLIKKKLKEILKDNANSESVNKIIKPIQDAITTNIIAITS